MLWKNGYTMRTIYITNAQLAYNLQKCIKKMKEGESALLYDKKSSNNDKNIYYNKRKGNVMCLSKNGNKQNQAIHKKDIYNDGISKYIQKIDDQKKKWTTLRNAGIYKLNELSRCVLMKKNTYHDSHSIGRNRKRL